MCYKNLGFSADKEFTTCEVGPRRAEVIGFWLLSGIFSASWLCFASYGKNMTTLIDFPHMHLVGPLCIASYY